MARVRAGGEAPHPAPPVAQRIRVRFAKRGRLRFLSHRDVARSLERAIRRAGLPVAYSQGFSPHPRLSWVGAAPTGAASEAEYVEIGLVSPVDPAEFARKLDAALPPGLDVLAAAVADDPPLAERINASAWRIELPGVSPATARHAVEALLATETLTVERVTPSGRRQIDVRAALVGAEVADRDGTGADVTPATSPGDSGDCAIIAVVVRQTTPAVRPDDVLSALDVVAGLRPSAPAKVTRTAQGQLDDRGRLADPLGSGRVTTQAEPGGPAAAGAPVVGTTSRSAVRLQTHAGA